MDIYSSQAALAGASLFEQGGPVMYVLLLSAVIGLTYVIYCFLTLRRGSVMNPALMAVAESEYGNRDFDSALAVCHREGGA